MEPRSVSPVITLTEDVQTFPPRAALAFSEDLGSELAYDQDDDELDTDPDTDDNELRNRSASGSGSSAESGLEKLSIGRDGAHSPRLSHSAPAQSMSATAGSHVYMNKLKRLADSRSLTGYVHRLPAFAVLHGWFYAFRVFVGSVDVGRITLGDLMGLFAPLVLIPVLFDLFVSCKPLHVRRLNRIEALLFLVSVGMFSQGSGIHLAANAINRPMDEDDAGFEESEFWDETIGHIWPYLALFVVHSLLVWSQYRHPFRVLTKANDESKFGLFQMRYRGLVAITVASAILHGFVFFANMVEGRFAWPGFVFNLLNIAFQCFLIVKRQFKNSPIYLFSLLYNSVAAVFTLGWLGLNEGALPEFSAVGLI